MSKTTTTATTTSSMTNNSKENKSFEFQPELVDLSFLEFLNNNNDSTSYSTTTTTSNSHPKETTTKDDNQSISSSEVSMIVESAKKLRSALGTSTKPTTKSTIVPSSSTSINQQNNTEVKATSSSTLLLDSLVNSDAFVARVAKQLEPRINLSNSQGQIMQSTIESNIKREQEIEKSRQEQDNRIRLQIESIKSIQESFKTELESIQKQQKRNTDSISLIRQDIEKCSKKSELTYQVHNLQTEISTLVSNDRLVARVKQLEQDVIKSSLALKQATTQFDSLGMKMTKRVDDIEGEVGLIKSDIVKTDECKVDNRVLEELMRHIATREELKKMLKSKWNHQKSNNNNNNNIVKNIQNELLDNDVLYKRIHDRIEQTVMNQITNIKTSILEIQHTLSNNNNSTPNIKQNLRFINNNEGAGILNQHETIEITNNMVEDMAKSITRDFDEKLYLICSDLASCKSAWEASCRQPYYKCGAWLWKSGKCILGSAIPWNYETTNTDPENFRWQQDQGHIKVAEAGLYEISFAFFTKSKPSIQLVINGESILSAINSPSYVVHHGSGFVKDGDGRVREGSVSGLSCLDYLALPAKSSVQLHYHGKKNGHGFLSLRRL